MVTETANRQRPSELLYGGVAVILLCTFILKYKRKKLPPGPSGVPIFGSVGFFRQFKLKRHHLLSELAGKYGNVFSVRAGNQLVVFLNGYETIREAFVEQGHIFSDRPNWLQSLQLGLADGKGLVWQNGCEAVSVRKFASQALREFGVGKLTLEQKLLLEIDEISQHLKQSQGEKIWLKPMMKKSITNVIHDIIFGERFHHDDQKLTDVVHFLEEFFKGGLFLPKNFLPKFICKLLPKDEKLFQEKQRIVEKLRQYIYSYISHHRAVYTEGEVNDFIDLFIKTSEEQARSETGSCFSEGEIFRTILDLFLAGAETTGSTLEWCFLFMVKYPDIQKKCFAEIETVLEVSKSGKIGFSDKRHVPYVEATLMEVQRLANVVPLGLPHVNNTETTVAGYRIPERTIVFANHYSCLMDPNLWSQPEEFHPERHLDGNGNVTSRREAYIPFGIGPRVCLGERMAKMELFLVFTNLVGRFEFSRSCESDLQVNTVNNKSVVNSSFNFNVYAKERVDHRNNSISSGQ